MPMTLPELLKKTVEMEGSDLHLTTNSPPQIRVHGKLQRLDLPPLSPAQTKQLAYSVCTDAQKKRFEETLELDFSFGVRGVGRFRCNVFNQRGAVASVYRVIPERVRGFHELGLPPVIAKLAERPRGLVLVTGPTGSGKSTTLSAIINEINEKKKYHVITIEDPIEFVHAHKQCLVTQREVGTSASGFAPALRAALREDPDLVLVGEMRDLETMQMALTAAESGLLVFGTMHTNSASKAIDRMINVFPADEQDVVRNVVGDTLRGVLAQQLVPLKDGGRVAAVEILFGSPALGTMVREGRTHLVANLIHMGKTAGMVTMDASLLSLVRSGQVEPAAAYEKAIDKPEFRRLLREECNAVVGADDDPDA